VTAGLDVTVMTPPHEHMHLESVVAIGMLASRTRDAEIHGVPVTGMQGIGVRTPSAAAVADATVGFAIELHMPNGTMFTMGLESMMFATGRFEPRTRFTGRTLSTEGARPNVHRVTLPVTRGLPTLRL
jgi:hypothetical protein